MLGTGTKSTPLPIDQIQPNRFQPRDHFDDGQIGELVANIESEGLLQPISVRKTQDGKYEIIVRGTALSGLPTAQEGIHP